MAGVVAQQPELGKDKGHESGVDQLQRESREHEQRSQAERQQAEQRQHRAGVVPGLLVEKPLGEHSGFEFPVGAQWLRTGRIRRGGVG